MVIEIIGFYRFMKSIGLTSKKNDKFMWKIDKTRYFIEKLPKIHEIIENYDKNSKIIEICRTGLTSI